MGVRESLLNTITSVGSSDFVRIVTSAGASSKATLANVIKSFETGLGAKSSLTTSDYVRVVGSDDVAYKQSIASVMTTMGIGRAVSYGDLASFYADFSAMATDVKYFVTTWGDCSTALGLPSGTYKGYATKSNATLCDMTVQNYGTNGVNVEYIGRVTFNSSGAVTATNWTKQPTRTEVDALNSTISTKITGIAQTGVATGIFSIRFINDQNNHTMALFFSSNPSTDGYKMRLYDVTNSWNIVWQYT